MNLATDTGQMKKEITGWKKKKKKISMGKIHMFKIYSYKLGTLL